MGDPSKPNTWIKDVHDLPNTVSLVGIIYVLYLVGQVVVNSMTHFQKLKDTCREDGEIYHGSREHMLRAGIAEVADMRSLKNTRAKWLDASKLVIRRRLHRVITAIGRTFERSSGSPDELSFGDDGGPDRRAEVSDAAETVRQVQFLLRYGDYAGMVWNVLRRISRLSDTPLPDFVVSFDTDLDVGGEDQDDGALPGGTPANSDATVNRDCTYVRPDGKSNPMEVCCLGRIKEGEYYRYLKWIIYETEVSST
ncbi:hypothetical protein LCP9604111_412 [Penicillium roqueforti]|uniref:uncharacterized protein n=1 Tax=Penicillium roqueforti TaxID=5082 RepID=UPI00190A49A2|nr:uncharacterized protein LCP9604111_412 [Penicillium roqueforti]KAF9252886.1 hypothetical protein LCP9604111_412 [Penicillium roqueforti]KAI2724101.1 hypothetical protein CBS147318_1032 [Penicillium roqueforti]KAI3132875.1 hypothetical protein CBS147330_4059 [Penicillium roqueforti]KAI3168709.1 hypothetical protein DTO039G3_5577 [Penicillium roqueforti]